MAVNSRALGKPKAMAFRATKSTKAKVSSKPANQAGRPTAAELERRKALAITVATELFINQGYAATSLVDIAKGAGVATRTIYQHFGDKEAMFREVIFARDTEAVLQPPLVEPGDTLFSALCRLADYAYSVTFRERSIGLMRLMIAESNRFPDFMRSIVNSIYGRFRQNIRKMFSSLEVAGLIPPGDHKRSAELFSDFVLGSSPIMTYTSWAPSAPDNADRDERIALFILGRFGQQIADQAQTRKAEFARQD
jgi:AcrR family transcriptional regulator